MDVGGEDTFAVDTTVLTNIPHDLLNSKRCFKDILSIFSFSICKKWDKFERIEYVQYADWSTFSGLQFFTTERRKEGWYQQKFGKLAAHYDPREPRGCNLQNLPLRPIGEHLGKTSLNKNITNKLSCHQFPINNNLLNPVKKKFDVNS